MLISITLNKPHTHTHTHTHTHIYFNISISQLCEISIYLVKISDGRLYLLYWKISLVESFLCPDKQGTPEKGRRIQQPERCEKKTIKTKTIVRKLLLIKIIYFFLNFVVTNHCFGLIGFNMRDVPKVMPSIDFMETTTYRSYTLTPLEKEKYTSSGDPLI